MSFLSSIGGLLEQYAGGAAPAGNVEDHFDQVAQNVPCGSLATGVAAAMRSGAMPPFSQIASQLFANANGGQQASMLNTLIASAGPELLQSFLGNNAGSAIGSLLQGGQTQVTPDQAASIPPEEVQALAAHVHQGNPSVIDDVSSVFSEHPTLFKSLGSAAMALAVQHISQSRAASA